ncbi:hypothetical protein EIP91_004594 [Steccherinum ochraceum]|uniref:Arrestin-like N-terminal domain-containing protein n=1 Tax=Steccherinum ochraceum TaxID=92696 RepID=A0A4R0REM8_9APHY|nr:hypothetical protein EIP91_004594 [Steccherinum ochraceum]
MATAVSLQPPSVDSLPSYTPRSGPLNFDVHNRSPDRHNDHAYHLVKNGKQWLTLSLRSQAGNDDKTPRFNQGHPITGSVRLALTNEAVIRSVSIMVTGELTSPAYYSRFLTMTRQLFVSDTNEVDLTLRDAPKAFAGKLKGEHTWPFSIRLPKGVCIVLSDAVKHNFRLPPTLTDLQSKAQIHYRVVVRVKKGLLNSDTRLSTEFTYTPLLRPTEPSILRQIAYLENQPLVGPEGDLEGWKSVEPFILTGKVFNARPVTAECTALDLLSIPVNSLEVVSPEDCHPEAVSTAVWWAAQERGGNTRERRVLHGEVNIPQDAPPSCRIVNFKLQYAITFLHLKAVGFTPSFPDGRKAALQYLHSEPIEVVTVPAHGPPQTSSLPPVYDAIPT